VAYRLAQPSFFGKATTGDPVNTVLAKICAGVEPIEGTIGMRSKK
jgi:hypothetical protein